MNTEKIVELAIQGHASTRDAIRWAIKQEQKRCQRIVEESSGDIVCVSTGDGLKWMSVLDAIESGVNA